ncbi:sensor histidine kinase [Jiangella alkaliphila]|uniref:histidine kinase n=1 Tax=Jiangella alkaliphila TaxID=419479 RepID=A0A1H2KB13_9ACTN|nr:HAMP domain-containing sensor histidine kinase [Jiangella alkaliphila]SDU65859.1 His Kinase A (phospho-acceptor) domain-containing protein [Jiangella alkaliphila]
MVDEEASVRAPRRRSVRWRFTGMYAALFLVSGAAMLVVVTLFAGGTLDVETGPGQPISAMSEAAEARIASLEHRLAQAQAQQTHQLLLGSAVGLVVMGLLSLLFGWYAAGRVLRPLRAMTSATRHISANSLHERLALTGPHDELRDLGDTIDELLARLEGSFAAERRFVADASHELRTPLATMRAAVDVTLAKPSPPSEQTRTLAERISTELDDVEQLLDGLMTLARAQHDLPEPESVPVDELVADALTARRLPIEQVLDAAPRAAVHGSRILLQRLVENLVANAVVHNQPGGWVHVTIRPAGSAVELVVENDGDVLTQDEVSKLTRPFQRVGTERTSSPGSGLGLAIVAAVAEAHGGRLELRPRRQGGLCVTVTLPRAVEEALVR